MSQRNGRAFPCAHLGIVLRFLRNRRDLSQLDVVIALETHGYRMRTAVYRRMETGRHRPEDAQEFVRAYSAALGLTREELNMLLAQWAFDELRPGFGESLAWEAVRDALAEQAPLSSP
jgi:hypothetical protein